MRIRNWLSISRARRSTGWIPRSAWAPSTSCRRSICWSARRPSRRRLPSWSRKSPSSSSSIRSPPFPTRPRPPSISKSSSHRPLGRRNSRNGGRRPRNSSPRTRGSPYPRKRPSATCFATSRSRLRTRFWSISPIPGPPGAGSSCPRTSWVRPAARTRRSTSPLCSTGSPRPSRTATSFTRRSACTAPPCATTSPSSSASTSPRSVRRSASW